MTPPTHPTAALAEMSRAAKLLDAVRSLPQAIEFRSRAAAVEAYARASKSSELLSLAQEVRLRSERKAGEHLIRMKESGELSAGRQHANSVTLTELGVDENNSRRWQIVARIPADDFEDYVRRAWVKTHTGLVRMAEKDYAPPAAAPPAGTGAGERAEEPAEEERGLTCACSCECCMARGEHEAPAQLVRGREVLA